jgi:hypothetical protein
LKFNEDEDLSDSDSYFSENDDEETMKKKAEKLIDNLVDENGNMTIVNEENYDSEGNLEENFKSEPK